MAIAASIAAFLTIVTVCGEPVFISGADENGRVLSVGARHLYEDGSDVPLFLEILEQLPTNKDGDPILVQEEVGTAAQCPTQVSA